jgi:hypothetical protein
LPACPKCGSTALAANPADPSGFVCDDCGEASRWSHAVIFGFGDTNRQISADEAREIVAKLRTTAGATAEPSPPRSPLPSSLSA